MVIEYLCTKKFIDIVLYNEMVEKKILGWLLNSIFAPLTRTNTDGLFKISDKYFSVTDSPRVGTRISVAMLRSPFQE